MAIRVTILGPHGFVTRTLTPLSAIVAHCAECLGWTRGEVERCTSPLCALFEFRLGDGHTVSEERRQHLAVKAKEALRGESRPHFPAQGSTRPNRRSRNEEAGT